MKAGDMMKWFDIFKKKNKENEPVIIAIHGFGKRRTDEFLPLFTYFKDRHQIIAPELFDQRYPSDNIWYNWVSKAEEKVIEAKNEKREIILIGFSMGGVIASYLASKFKIKRLILLAPAFEYLTPTTAKGYAFGPKRPEEKDRYVPLPSEYTSTFIDVVNNCKKGIDNVTCPTMFIACMNDELIPYTVSLKYYKKLKTANKKCIILADGEHRLLDNEVTSNVVLSLIDDFIEGKLDDKDQSIQR